MDDFGGRVLLKCTVILSTSLQLRYFAAKEGGGEVYVYCSKAVHIGRIGIIAIF